MLTFKTLDWFELFQQCSFESSFSGLHSLFMLKQKTSFCLCIFSFVFLCCYYCRLVSLYVCRFLFLLYLVTCFPNQNRGFFLSQPTSTKTFHPNEIACIQNVRYTPNTLSQIQLYSLVEVLMLYKDKSYSVWCFTGLEYFQLTKTFSLMLLTCF
jgi:hypothetical protein